MDKKQLINESAIENFYLDGSVLITGATGFLGQALVEKLLRSVPGIKYIYILIRPKRNIHESERFINFKKYPIFREIQAENPELIKKVIPVYGDLRQKSLGLNRIDEENIINNVTVVFHSAATVSFNGTFADTFKSNTIGTYNTVEFSRYIKNIKAFVYVSTAFSNSDRNGKIDEKIYDPPFDVNRCIETWQDDPSKLNDLAKEIKSNHPNTYTLTKNMAEWVIMERVNFCAAAIVRPSIVTAAWRDPMPGWVESESGMNGMLLSFVAGRVSSTVINVNKTADIIPVDIVVNTLIVSAWHVVNKKEEKFQIYNCTSGRLNRFTYAELEKFANLYSIEVPTNKLIWYPKVKFIKYRWIHYILDFLFDFIPNQLYDVFSKPNTCNGSLSAFQLYRKSNHLGRTIEYFALNDWDFVCENQTSLKTELPVYDRKTFETGVQQINWSTYFKQYVLGIRTYLLNDPIDTLPAARIKLKRLYCIHRALQIFTIMFIIQAFLFIYKYIF